jgi:putative ABC transport system permease protein
MYKTRWRKVFIDLWSNRTRTLVVALAIAVGVYAVTLVSATRELLVREFDSDQEAAVVSSAVIYTYPFDSDLADRIAEIPGVAAAEGRHTIRARVTNQSGRQQNLVLICAPSLTDAQLDIVNPLDGKWPPEKNEVTLERLTPDHLGIEIGDSLTFELENGVVKTLKVVGTAHDPQQLGPAVTDTAIGFISTETMDALGLGYLFDELHIRVAEHTDDESHIQTIVEQATDQLERSGRPALSTRIYTESIITPYIDTVVFMLQSFGNIILLLSGFLVVNAISALISQQIQQIGVMKLIGARRRQIIGMYGVTAVIYGLIAVAIGIPLALLTARLLMSELVEDLVNVMVNSYATSPLLLLVQIAIGLLLPVIAGLIPVWNGTRITTHQALNQSAISQASSGKQTEKGDLAGRVQALQRPLLLSIRNALRHKGRLAQTLFVLIVGTALFISVLTVRSSVDLTLANFLSFHLYDVSVGFDRPYRTDLIEQAALQVPHVTGVESWSIGNATRIRPDGSESDPLRIYGVPPETAFIDPQLTDGSWLDNSQLYDIVINTDLVDDERDLEVGDSLVLETDGREFTWNIAGIVSTDSQGASAYVNMDDYAYVTRTPGQANHIQVISDDHSAAAQQNLEGVLLKSLEADGFVVSSTQTSQQINSMNQLMFTIVIAVLILMALLLAAVGGLGLTTTMSINVLERIREIGVLRAIGATNHSIRRIILSEGFVIGLLSWLLGTLISLPLSALMSEQVGLALLSVPLRFHYSIGSALLWFFAMQVVALVASLGPAERAAQLTIREVLAYE